MEFEHARHQALWAYIQPHLSSDDLSHDADHVLRVYVWCLRLAPEAGVDDDLAGAAGLAHDLVNVAKDDPDRARAGERSAAEARGMLRGAGYDDGEIERIAEAVRTSNWSAGLAATEPLGEVLQDADRLDAIGAIGIFRTFTCSQRLAGSGRRLRFSAPDDPVARHGRTPDDTRYALDHFPVKLLELAAGMHFPSSREEAARRQATMVALLDEMERELGGIRH